jgi:hypothetical protein
MATTRGTINNTNTAATDAIHCTNKNPSNTIPMVSFTPLLRSQRATRVAIAVLSHWANADVRWQRDASEPSNPTHYTSIACPTAIANAPQPICCRPALSRLVRCLWEGGHHRLIAYDDTNGGGSDAMKCKLQPHLRHYWPNMTRDKSTYQSIEYFLVLKYWRGREYCRWRCTCQHHDIAICVSDVLLTTAHANTTIG